MAVVIVFLMAAAVFVLFALFCGVPVYFLWNWVAVELGAPHINFGQALLLSFLGRFLCGGFNFTSKSKD